MTLPIPGTAPDGGLGRLARGFHALGVVTFDHQGEHDIAPLMMISDTRPALTMSTLAPGALMADNRLKIVSLVTGAIKPSQLFVRFRALHDKHLARKRLGRCRSRQLFACRDRAMRTLPEPERIA